MNLGCWISGWTSRSLSARLVALAAVMFAAYACTLVVAMRSGGTVGGVAVSLAAGVSLLSASAALWMSYWLSDPANGLAGILLPMMVRTGLPLLLAVVVRIRGQGLVEAGLVYYLVGFYLLALAVELPMSLPCNRRSQRCSEPSGRTDGGLHG